MAKLPDRPRTANIGPARTISPSVAVGKYQQRLGLANTVFEIGQQVANDYIEDQVNIANAEHRQTALDTMAFSEENQVLTQKQLKDLGILDKVNTKDAAGNEMQVVPRHRWRAILLEHNVEESRNKYAGQISQPNARKAWGVAASKADSELVARVTMQTAQDAWEYHANEMKARYDLAVERGDWQIAQEVIDSQVYNEIYASTPGLKKNMQQQVDQGREKDLLYTRAMSNDPDELDRLVTEMTDPNYIDKSSLPLNERRSIVSAAITRQNYLLTRDKQQRDLQSQAIAATFENQIDFDMANFNPGEVDKALKSGRLNYTDYRLVMGAYRKAQTGDNFKVPPQTDAFFENQAFDIEMGYGDPDLDYQAQVQKLSDWVRQRREMGDVDAATVNRWNDRIRELREQPYRNPEYKLAVDELSRMILGVDEASPFAAFSTDESSLEFQTAKNDLVQWMLRNGGAQADITEWRVNRLPAFLQGAAKRSFFKLPDGVTSAVVYKTNASGREVVDRAGTMAALRENIRKSQVELDKATSDSAKSRLQAQIKKNRQHLVDFENYVNGIGRVYVE